MAATKRMLVVTDAAGKVVAAAHLDGHGHPGTSVGLVPMPGQTVHEVDVPEVLTRLTSGHDFHMAMSQTRIDPATGKVVFRHVTHRKKP